MKTPFKFALSAVAATLAFGAFAQDFPAKDRTVTIVVPFAAGGPTDRVARDLAEALRKPLGRCQRGDRQRCLRGSTIGTAKAARATPDGYTLLHNHIGMATMPALYRKLPFNVVNDFEPGHRQRRAHDADRQAFAARQPLQGARHLDRAEQGQDQLGNAGLGAASHLCGLLFQSRHQVEMTTIAYKGTGRRPSPI